MRDDDFCCHCHGPMPESVTDWFIDVGAHMYCREDCADQGPDCGEE